MPAPSRIRVSWNAEWQEYVVKMPDGTYHTNDVEDAYNTARLEAIRLDNCPIILGPTVTRRLRNLKRLPVS